MYEYLDNIMSTLTYLGASFVLFFFGKVLYQLFHSKINIKDELVEKDNTAFALAHVGYFIGLLFVIGSVMMGESYGLWLDMIAIGKYGGVAIILLNISIIFNDKVILRHFSVRKEIIDDQNEGTGVIEGAMAVATGMIIMGSVYGDGNWLTLFAYWIIGQILLMVTLWVYNAITPYNIHEHIEKDNIAVGIGAAGAMIAIGNLIRFALMHDFESWVDTAQTVAIDVVIGLLFLPVARWVSDRILLPGRKLTDEIVNQDKPNIGAAMVEAFSYIGGSVLLTWALL
jgi:uncharacterized membrane protein YjfL (UPF0719 family)